MNMAYGIIGNHISSWPLMFHDSWRSWVFCEPFTKSTICSTFQRYRADPHHWAPSHDAREVTRVHIQRGIVSMPLGTVPDALPPLLLKKTLAGIMVVLLKDALRKTILTSHHWMKPSRMWKVRTSAPLGELRDACKKGSSSGLPAQYRMWRWKTLVTLVTWFLHTHAAKDPWNSMKHFPSQISLCKVLYECTSSQTENNRDI